MKRGYTAFADKAMCLIKMCRAMVMYDQVCRNPCAYGIFWPLATGGMKILSRELKSLKQRKWWFNDDSMMIQPQKVRMNTNPCNPRSHLSNLACWLESAAWALLSHPCLPEEFWSKGALKTSEKSESKTKMHAATYRKHAKRWLSRVRQLFLLWVLSSSRATPEVKEKKSCFITQAKTVNFINQQTTNFRIFHEFWEPIKKSISIIKDHQFISQKKGDHPTELPSSSKVRLHPTRQPH